MTLFFAVGGVDIGNASVRLENGINGLTSLANGDVATAGVTVDDPNGTFNFIDLQTFTVIETACTAQPRCFTGYIYNLRQKRGPYRNLAGCVWEFDVGDLNFLLHLEPLRVAAAKRDRETIDDRIAYLLGAPTGLYGKVYDNGLVASRGASMIDETDYRRMFSDEFLGDISTGWIYFVYWNGTQPSLFFDDPTAAVNNSTLSLSNVLSDVVANPTTVFAPNQDAELLAAGEAIYCGVDYTYIGGANIYRHSQTTHDAFFTDPNFHRVGSVTTDRVGRLATAEAEAARYLALHSGEIDTITLTVQLPSSKVNLIDAGMMVPTRLSHLRGYTGPGGTSIRVSQRTLNLSQGTPDFYDVQLELSTKGISNVSGGSPGDFPHQNTCSDSAGTVVQVGGGDTLIGGRRYATMPAPVTPGNTLVRFASKRATAGGPSSTGIDPRWISIPPGTFNDPSAGHGGHGWYRLADGTDTDKIDIDPGGNSFDAVVELEGDLTLIDSAVNNSSSGTSVVGPSVTPTAGTVAAVLGFIMGFENTATGPHFAPAAGWTELADASDTAGQPQNTIVYKHVSSAVGSYAPAATFDYNGGWAVESVAFSCANSNSPPSPAQWVGPVVITMTGDAGTFPFPFADGSLTVWVDDTDQTAKLVSYDGTTGAFQLGFTPTPTEVTKARAQGR